MLSTAVSLSSGEAIINGFHDLLSRRLGGSSLVLAMGIVKRAMHELGGGPRRVEQRLRSTLQWCRDEAYRGLTLNAAAKTIGSTFRHTLLKRHKTGHAHVVSHMRTVRSVSHELGLPAPLRRALVNQSRRLALRARDLALTSTSEKLNRLRDPSDTYRLDLARADRRRRIIKQKDAHFRAVCRLSALQKDGWVVRAITITLPASYHAGSYLHGLAGSPDADQCATTLRALWAASMPSKDVFRRLAGFWRIECTDDKQTPHIHAVVAYKNHREADAHHERLKQSYIRSTYSGWSLDVVSSFGIACPPWCNWSIPIYVEQAHSPEHLAQCVSYCLKGIFSGTPPMVSGRCYAMFGVLRSDPSVAAIPLCVQEGEKDNRIKTYQDMERVHSHSASRPSCAVCWVRFSELGPRFERPQCRAPPVCELGEFQER